MNYTTQKISDLKVTQKLWELAQGYENTKEVSASFRLQSGNNNISEVVQGEFTSDGIIFDGLDFEQLQTSSGTFVLSFKVGTGSYSCTIKRRSVLDEVTVDFGMQNQRAENIHPAQLMKWTQQVQKEFPQHGRDEKLDKLIGDELAEFYRKREEALCRLEGANQELFENLAKQKAQANEAIAKERLSLQESWEQKQQKLEEEHQNRLDALEEKQAQLDQREAEINDNNSKYERRSLRDQLKKSIQSRNEKFTVTKDTIRTRLPIHIMYIFLILSSFVFLVLFSLHLSMDPTDYILLIKTVSSSAVMLTTALLYIRWNDAWSQRYANEEFNQKRLELDIDRASWVVEMLLEWDEAKDKAIPPELIERLTNSLFDRVEEEPSGNHHADFLSTLLGGTSAIDLNVPGGSMHMKRSGVKKLRRHMGDE